MHKAFNILVAAVGMQVAMAQPPPMITGGPVNAASYARAGLPNAGIAQGGMFVVFGNNLGPQMIQIASSFPLQKTLAGTSIQITIAGSNFDALMIYAQASQVAAIVPSSAPVGDGTIVVSVSGRATAATPIHVVANSFGIFTRNQAGTGPAIVFNFNSQSDQPVNSLIGAANPAQVLTIWGTGLGAVNGDEAGGPLPGDLNLAVDVFIGGKPANIRYKGRSGCCAGIDQIVADVPAGVQGCAVSLAVRVAGVVSNFATIAVAPSGKLCSDPGGFSTSDLAQIGPFSMTAIADVGLTHVGGILTVPGQGPLQLSFETARANFRRYPGTLLASDRGAVRGIPLGIDAPAGYPSLGSCIVYPFSLGSGPFAGVDPFVDDPVPFQSLNAGQALNLSGPLGAKQVPRLGSGTYRADIGGAEPGSPMQPLFLMPGAYTLDNASGGVDVGALRSSLTIPSSQPALNNPGALSTISRSQDLTVTWSGGTAGGLIAIFGTSVDPTLGAGTQVYCSERSEAGQFTIPSWVLSAMPATGQSQTQVLGTFAFESMLQPSRFQATGVNVGFFNWGTIQYLDSVFQ